MPFAQLDDLRLHYLDHSGPAEAPPLVLLHGLGSSSRDWEMQVPAFGTGRRVIAPDLRGFGQTDKPPGPYHPSLFARDVFGLLDQLGIERFDLLGYSMGGAGAFQMAVDAPERIRRLVLVNTTPTFEVTHFRMRLEVWVRLAVIKLLGMETLAGLIAKRLFPKDDQEELRQLCRDRYSANAKESYAAALNGLTQWSVVDQLGGIDLPTLVVAADQDYTSVAVKEQYVAAMPDARLVVVEDSRHGTPLDQPEIFNETVLSFLDR